MLGTFWRDTAVEQEEIEYFATGHPIVEALFGFLRDGPYGRNGCRAIQNARAAPARGLELLFHVVPPEPEDTSPGARVPSRQLSRVLDRSLLRVAVTAGPDGAPGVEPKLLELLAREEGRSLQGDQIRAAFPDLASFVAPGDGRGDAGGERRAPEPPDRGARGSSMRSGTGSWSGWSERCGTRASRRRRSRRSSSRSASTTARWPRRSTG